MRVIQKVNIQSYLDASQVSSYLALSDDQATQIIDNFTSAKWDAFNIAATATYNVPLSDGQPLLVRSMWIKAIGDYDVTINGAATPLQCRRVNTATGTWAQIYFDGVITSISITNQTTAAVLSGIWFVAGDPQ